MSLSERLSEFVAARVSPAYGLSATSRMRPFEISQLCRQEQWRLLTWDIAQCFNPAGTTPDQTAAASTTDPLAAIKSLAAAGGDEVTLLLLPNFHRFLGSAEIVQTLYRQILAGKQRRTFVVVLAPSVQIPPELEKLFVVLDHDLPNREQLKEIASGIATEAGELPQGTELDRVLDAASGLTRYEAEGAFSLALVRHGTIEPATLWEMKTQTLKRGGLLSLYRGGESFQQVGGLESLKAFCKRAMRRQGDPNSLRRPRGVFLLGVPGTGKSAFCKSLGNESGRPTLILDIGSLMGSLVGQTESQTRQALRVVDAMAPCILMVDEIEKALSGLASSGQTDSGVSARMFGSLLTWLNDHESDVFVVCTANDVSKLPPELTRAERFDGVFFLDLPCAEQKEIIWRQYISLFGLDASQERPSDDRWTGAEIRSCCRLSALLDIPLTAAAQNVVPVAVTASESVDRLRTWASGRCLSADRSGIYRKDDRSDRPRRRVSRNSIDPSNN